MKPLKDCNTTRDIIGEEAQEIIDYIDNMEFYLKQANGGM